jgi:DNA primase
MLGLEVEQVAQEVSRAGKVTVQDDGAERQTSAPDDVTEPALGEAHLPMPDPRDPVVAAERQLLQVLLQFPGVLRPGAVDLLTSESFSAPAHRAVFDGIRVAHAAGGAPSGRGWTSAVSEAAPTVVSGLISELAVAPVPTRMDALTGLPTSRYVEELFARVRTIGLTRRIADAMSELRRLEHGERPDHDRSRELGVELQGLQRELAAIKEGMS